MDENRKTILNSIKDYFMNPAKTLNDQRSKIEETINELDDVLKGTGKDSGLCEDFFDFLVKSSELIDIIKKSRADEQGLSATRGYKDYYFNEIIQNANDNTKGTVITISVSKENDYYVLSFEYDDDGFSTENLIGFFNSEIHTKGQDNSTTGKHGVGIKSLFYFVDSMEIKSNVQIKIQVNTVQEDGIEKFQEEPVTVKISKNDQFSEKTVLTIKFRGGEDEERSGQVIFNTSKLEEFIDKCLEKNLDSMNEYFFNQESGKLIFDARALLFTDKNRDKVGGIKRICFRDAAAENLFEIFARTDDTTKETEVFSCEDKNGNLYTLQEDVLSIRIFNTEPQVIDKYLVIKKQFSDKKKQNFTVAFPGDLEYKKKGRTYYETYFIPYSKDERFNYNLLVNTDHSSPDRTRLTDGNDLEDIFKEVDSGLCDVYEFVFSEKCQSALSKKLNKQLSVLFHQMLLKDGMAEGSFLSICLERNISNRYLMKYTDENVNTFLMYRRNEKEEYEKKLIGQKTDVKDIKVFFEKHILSDDSVKYEQDNLLNDDIKKAYETAFEENDDPHMKLRRVLNLAGDIKNLIYYRIRGEFCVDNNLELPDSVVDQWTDKLESMGENGEIGLSLIGRYGLNSRIDNSGHITDASFYYFLFSDDPISNPVDADTSCEKFRNEASSKFADLKGLKERLRKGMLSYSDGNRKIAFWASWDTRARCYTDIISCENLKWHNGELNDEDVKQLICRMSIDRDHELINHIKYIFLQDEPRLVLTGPDYPTWGIITFNSGVSSLATAQKKDTEFIDFSFLLNLNAKSWNEYCDFYDFISNQDKLEKLWTTFQIVTPDKGVEIDVSELKELFKFLYKHDTKKNWIICQLNLCIEGDPKNLSNQCPKDLLEFIERLTGKKVYLWEVPPVNKRWEVLYGYRQEIKSYNNQEWTQEATIINYEANDNRVIILFNGKKDYREAIQSVLKSILGKADILDKLDAFLTSSNNMQIQGEKYDRLGKRIMEDNDKYSRRFSSDIATDQFTCEQLIKLILARGIQDHKCACCGCDLLDEKQAKLIISNNENDESKEDFPQIYEVVCAECKSLLKSSLNRAEIVIQEKEKKIKYRCVGGNSRQSDPVCWEHKVADGLISICRKTW